MSWSKERQLEYMREYYIKNKDVMREKNQAWREKNKELHLSRAREYHKENRERLLERKRNHRKQNPDLYAKKLRLKKYGLSHDQYEKMLQAQDGKCAICREPGKLVVDHHHETDVVRALLCSPCNTAIGLFKEDTERMQAAIRYLGGPT